MEQHADRLARSLAPGRLDLAELAAYVDEYHGPKADDSPRRRTLGERDVVRTTLMSWPSPLTVPVWPHDDRVVEIRARHFDPTVAASLLDAAAAAETLPAEGGLRCARVVTDDDPLPHFDAALLLANHGFHDDVPALARRTVRVAPVASWEIPEVVDPKMLAARTGMAGRLSLVAWERDPHPFVRLRVVDGAVPYRETKRPFVTNPESLLGYASGDRFQTGRAELWDHQDQCLTAVGDPPTIEWSIDGQPGGACARAHVHDLIRACLEGGELDALNDSSTAS